MRILYLLLRQKNTEKVNYEYSVDLGSGYVLSVLKQDPRIKITTINLNHYSGNLNAIIKNIFSEQVYDCVLFGCLSFMYLEARKTIYLVRRIVKGYKPLIIVGGPIFSVLPQKTFELLQPDIGVVGEAELIIKQLIDALLMNTSWQNIKGLVYDKANNITFTGFADNETDIDTVPWPALDDLEYSKTLAGRHPNKMSWFSILDTPRVYPVLTSRSCPYDCSFCYNYASYRERSLESVEQELLFNIPKYHANLIQFYDQCLSVDKLRLLKLCKIIQNVRANINWDIFWIANMSVDIDESTLAYARESGLRVVGYGFESMHDKVLCSMNKKFTAKQIEKTFHITRKLKIGFMATFIFGDIAETLETVQKTMDWWDKYAEGQVSLNFVEPFPGSKIFDYCLDKGIINYDSVYLTDLLIPHAYNMTQKMTDNEIKILRKKILYKSIKKRTFALVKRIFKKKTSATWTIQIECPFCKKTFTIDNCLITNKLDISFEVFCRHCFNKLFVVSFIRRKLYSFYVIYKHTSISIAHLYAKILTKFLEHITKKVIENKTIY